MASGAAPPAYDTALASFSEPRPLGTPEHLARAEQIVRELGRGDRVLAALPVSERARARLPSENMIACASIPCCWPPLLCASPWFISFAMNTSRDILNTIYIITNEAIIIDIAEHDSACCLSKSEGQSRRRIPLSVVGQVSTSRFHRGMCRGVIPAVRFSQMAMMTGRRVLHAGRHASSWHEIYVEDPEAVTELIRNACEVVAAREKERADAETAALSRMITRQPVAVAAVPTSSRERVFVALSTAPSAFFVFHIDNTRPDAFETLLMDIRAMFILEMSTPIQLTLAEMNALVTSAASISANDKLIATVARPPEYKY